ncbi:NADPH:quinone oxidoreductase family protein [Aminobacter niigataensis]|uniref:NADPH:quinone oxidoreductase family protein n=1 Tax=Aminobacter niigataensis TaxID=83265 RepID=UPI0024C71D0E|nr:NADPH:quinone oxidoreductase family protein [Aminobacter niigataensis]CAI2933115.1 Quinone oxidoreductase 1 [Aminobacter niigataensis]
MTQASEPQDTMAAVLSEKAGGPETLALRRVPIPEPAPGQVRIRVRAVGINYPDLLIIDDRYQYRPERPFSPGAEVSGIVEAVGEAVSWPCVGDRVMAMLGWGGMTEYVCVDAARCSPIPDSMPYDDAAVFLMAYCTAYHALRDRSALGQGETLLVLGAGGGVGLAAVELAKALGAKVVAAASTEEKLGIARLLGADETVLYPRGELGREGQKRLAGLFKAACGPDGASVVYDAVGGEYAEPAMRSIGWQGRYLVVGFAAGVPSLPLNLPLLKGCDVRGVFWGAAMERDPQRHHESVAELTDLYVRRKIKPSIQRRFCLEEAGLALNALAAREVSGKIVLSM